MKIKYQDRKFNAKSLDLIEKVNGVIAEYRSYDLTLRQIYYQLVARGFIANSEKSYDNIGELVSNARLAGLIDWNAIEDRTRNARGGGGSNSTPAERIEYAANYFSLNIWTGQPNYAEIWVEKDALIDVVGRGTWKNDAVYFSSRGYCSQTAMWEAAQRFIREGKHKKCYLLYLGDHDPSGLDMTRDIAERLKLFGADVQIKRIALTMEQIQQFNPPPNPAKLSDTRAADYIRKFGEHSWELDALEPRFIEQLIDSEVHALMDMDIVAKVRAMEAEQKKELQLVADNYHEVVAYLQRNA